MSRHLKASHIGGIEARKQTLAGSRILPLDWPVQRASQSGAGRNLELTNHVEMKGFWMKIEGLYSRRFLSCSFHLACWNHNKEPKAWTFASSTFANPVFNTLIAWGIALSLLFSLSWLSNIFKTTNRLLSMLISPHRKQAKLLPAAWNKNLKELTGLQHCPFTPTLSAILHSLCSGRMY